LRALEWSPGVVFGGFLVARVKELGWSGKNRRRSSIFDSCWRNEVSNFCLRKFGEVVPFCEHYEADVDINTENS